VRPAGLLEPRQREAADRFTSRRLRNLRQHPRVVQRVDSGETGGLAHPFERVRRQIAQHRQRVFAHSGVGVFARDRRQHSRIHQLADGGTPDAGVLVFTGGGSDLLMLR